MGDGQQQGAFLHTLPVAARQRSYKRRLTSHKYWLTITRMAMLRPHCSRRMESQSELEGCCHYRRNRCLRRRSWGQLLPPAAACARASALLGEGRDRAARAEARGDAVSTGRALYPAALYPQPSHTTLSPTVSSPTSMYRAPKGFPAPGEPLAMLSLDVRRRCM